MQEPRAQCHCYRERHRGHPFSNDRSLAAEAGPKRMPTSENKRNENFSNSERGELEEKFWERSGKKTRRKNRREKTQRRKGKGKPFGNKRSDVFQEEPFENPPWWYRVVLDP